MTGRVTLPSSQLLVYGFGPGADFEGRLVGALERIEAGNELRILDALFVMRDAETGEIVALDLCGHGARGVAGPLVGFRLDQAERRRATKRALSDSASGVPGETLHKLANTLEPGAALAAVLVEHRWARTLADTVSRTGGTALADEFVDATALGDLAPRLLAAAGRADFMRSG